MKVATRSQSTTARTTSASRLATSSLVFAAATACESAVEVIDGDQVARRRVHALETLAHGCKLRLERGRELLRIGRGERGVPGDRVAAAVVAAGLAERLLDVRRRRSEQCRRLGQ